MTTSKIQATIKTKDGTRIFNLSLHSLSPTAQETLRIFFTKKDSISLEELLSFCVAQTEKNSKLHHQNQLLEEESHQLQKQIERICSKLEEI